MRFREKYLHFIPKLSTICIVNLQEAIMSAPLYMQIKRFILDKIESGEWMVGQRIATEFELTEQFSVSRMTVNKAIRDLVNEGKLQRRPRLGTFVCDPVEKSESPLLDIRNIAEEVSDRGRQYSSNVLKQVAIKADDKIAIKLGVMLGSTVFYSEIIHYEDSKPIQLELRWVNSQYAPGYLSQDFMILASTLLAVGRREIPLLLVQSERSPFFL